MRVSILILFTLMNLSKLHNALARGVFAMDPQRAEAYMPTVLSMMSGEGIPQAGTAHLPGDNYQGELRPFAIHPITGEKWRCVREWTEQGVVYGFIGAKAGSVAVIPVNDAIMKYDYCGAYGTVSNCQVMEVAIADSNIVGILLDMDTPGGEVYGTKSLADMVATCPKPVIAHINDGYCASAGMYIAAGADRILMAQPTDQIGSIGVYTTLIDSRGAYEKEGYKLLTIYSPTSPEKNLAWREAMDEGKVKRMEAELAFLDKIFMDTVRAGRPNVKEEALKGGMFFTDEAIAMGLCDGYATQQEAIEMCVNLSGRSMIINS